MRYLVNSFHLILVLFLTACAQQASEEYVLPDFPRNSSADLAIISNDVYYNVIHDIYSYHNYIIVIANDVASGKYVHIYDKKSGDIINSGLTRGRGQNETMMGFMNTYFDKKSGLIKMWDSAKRSLLLIDVNALASASPDAVSKIYYDFADSWVRHRIPIDDKFLNVYNPSYLQEQDLYCRMVLNDNQNDTLSVLTDFPDISVHERYHIYNNSVAALSDDSKTLVLGTSCGAILEIFSIQSNQIKAEYTGKFSPVLMLDDNIGIDTDNTNYGFADIDVVNGNILTAFHGTKAIDTEIIFNDIAIWDLKGRPLRKIEIKYTIQRLTYDEKDKMLYLVVSDDEGMYLAKLVLPL